MLNPKLKIQNNFDLKAERHKNKKTEKQVETER
jgi:hypothetical protein